MDLRDRLARLAHRVRGRVRSLPTRAARARPFGRDLAVPALAFRQPRGTGFLRGQARETSLAIRQGQHRGCDVGHVRGGAAQLHDQCARSSPRDVRRRLSLRIGRGGRAFHRRRVARGQRAKRHLLRHRGATPEIAAGISEQIRRSKKRQGEETMDVAGTRASVDDIVARLERLPTSWWQVKARIIVGVATFFDAFDALAIASVLPVIVPLWKLTPPQIGLMISAGFLGQLLGALLFGWIAERYGRMTAMVWSIALFAVMSLACALAWDYNSLLALRTVQGIGLGGEVPVAAVFISELAKAKGRGRFVLLYELVFPIGLVAASLAGLWVVPRLGWQYMFVIGALPALLALVLRSLLPESPRWLAVHGRHAEAEAAMSLIEAQTQKATGAPLPPVKPVVSTADKPAALADLFGPLYLRRTLVVWVVWFSAYFVNYGLSIWLPTLYRTVFKLPLDVSLRYGLITQAVGLLGTLICALTIDQVGRRPWFAFSFAAATLALGTLALFPAPSAEQVLTFMTVAYFFISTINIGVYLYTPELYPTRVRALAVGVATAWLRFASIIGPTVVGMMLAGGLPSVFATFATVAAVAAAITGLYAVETKGRVLEEASP